MSCFYWLESSKWCILKTCYTGGCQLQRFRHYFTDGLNQSLISCFDADRFCLSSEGGKEQSFSLAGKDVLHYIAESW